MSETNDTLASPPRTSAPQPIGSAIEPALRQLQSLRVCSDAESEEWERGKLAREMPGRLEAAGYPARAIKTLDQMCGPGFEAAKECVSLVGASGLLFLIGDRGPGKTQIATFLAAQRILARGTAGIYRKALDLWGDIKATWRQGSTANEADVIRRYCRAGFLVIDEAQERGDTEADRQWCDRMLTHILDHRYDAMLPTVIVANLSVESYEKTIPASVRSRVSEAGGVKVCGWPSYR